MRDRGRVELGWSGVLVGEGFSAWGLRVGTTVDRL